MTGAEVAAQYAAHGWPVFPVKPRAKEPLTLNGFKSATTDQTQIAKWWTTWPDANIGFVPGRAQLLVLDLDGPEGEAAAQALGALAEPTRTVQTARGQHLYFQHPGGTIGNPPLGPHLDVRADAGYVLLPPSRHPSGKRYRWINPKEEIRPAPPGVVAALHAEATAAAVSLPDQIAEGQRNSQLFSLAGSLQRRAASPAAIRAALAAENQQRCRPPLPETELDEIVESIQRYAPSVGGNGRSAPAPSERERFRLIPEDEWAAMPPPAWLVQGWLTAGSLAVLFGASGTGKSFVALELAYAVARGVPWLEQAVAAPGPVLYLAGEGGLSLRARCAAYRQYHGVTGDVPLLIVPDLVRLGEPADVNALTTMVLERWPEGARLVILDTFAAACAGLLDENSSQEMTQALTALAAMQRRLQAAVVVVHHTGWSTTERERGSSVLRGAWDVALNLMLDGVGGISLRVAKARDFEQAAAIPVRLLAAQGSAVVVREDRPPEQRPLMDADRKLLRTLHELGGAEGLSASEWARVSELPPATFYRARKRLQHYEAVVCEHRRYQVSLLGQAVL